MTCGKKPCKCDDGDKVYIPFMGESINNTTFPNQLASFIRHEDRVPILLALSLYSGTPRNDLEPELIESSVTPRTACWIFENTIIVGTRGTCVGCKEGTADLKDDKVSFFIKQYLGGPRFLRFLDSIASRLFGGKTISVHNV